MDNRENPAWWNSQHASRWEVMKEALRRDWDQTRADLSGNRKGEDLNQNVDDTLAQAFGNRPIPPLGAPNPLDGPELEHKVKDAQSEMRKAEKEYEGGAEKTAKDLAARWADAEAPVRYGFAAATHFGGVWTADVERAVRADWSQYEPNREWEDVRDEVRFAWERAAGERASAVP